MSRSHSPIFLALIALCAALAAAVWLAGCGGSAGPATASAASDAVVLHVNGRTVRHSQVDAVRAELRLGGSSDTAALAQREVIRRELVRQEAERLGVAADPKKVEARRASLVGQVGGEQALSAQLKKLSMTDAQLRSGLRDGVLRDGLQDVKFKKVVASVAEARTFYRQNRASFRLDGSVHLWMIQVQAKAIAESAVGRLQAGRPFAEVARQFTIDAEAKDQGGDMGVVLLSSVPEPLRKAVEHTPVGQITSPVHGPAGWYVLKAADLKPAHQRSFAEVETRLIAELTRRDRFKALDVWLDAARGRASVTRP